MVAADGETVLTHNGKIGFLRIPLPLLVARVKVSHGASAAAAL